MRWAIRRGWKACWKRWASPVVRITVLTASARSDGNTRAMVDAFLGHCGALAEEIDLARLRIGPFDYRQLDDRDDFLSVVETMARSEHIVFATPVYWYAMSGLMKTFFDRLTDLLLVEANRPLGRALAGRRVWLLATGTEEGLPPGFTEPFARTAAYFAMDWRAGTYCRSDGDSPLAGDALAPAEKLADRVMGEIHMAR